MVEFFFYELPHSTPANPAEVVLSGKRTLVTADNVYPFTYHVTFELDARSTALIGKSEVVVPNTELLHDEGTDYQVDTPPLDTPLVTPIDDSEETEAAHVQLSFDFDSIPDTAPAPAPAEPEALTLIMSKGSSLGRPLKDFMKDRKVNGYPTEHVTIDKHGISRVYVNSYNKPEPLTDPEGKQDPADFMPMPKGIMAKGKASITINAEVLYRILQTTAPPALSRDFQLSGKTDRATTAPQRKLMYGLGKDFTEIIINGKVEIKQGKFTAIVPHVQPLDETETETE